MKKSKIGKLIALGAIFSVGTIMAQPEAALRADPELTSESMPANAIITERRVAYDTTKVRYKRRIERYTGLRRGELGLRYMPTFSSFQLRTSSGEVVQGEVTLNHGWGAIAGFNFSKNLGIVAGVNYLEIEQKYKDRNLERTVGVNYLNIPVMLSINTNKTKPVNLNFVVGPQVGINMGTSLSTQGTGETETVQAVVGVKEGEVGLVYGTGLEIALNPAHTIRADIGFLGFQGLVDMNADEGTPNTYNVIVKCARKSYGGYLGLAWCF